MIFLFNCSLLEVETEQKTLVLEIRTEIFRQSWNLNDVYSFKFVLKQKSKPILKKTERDFMLITCYFKVTVNIISGAHVAYQVV